MSFGGVEGFKVREEGGVGDDRVSESGAKRSGGVSPASRNS